MNTLFNVSLWGDEAFSALLAQKPFLEMLKIVVHDTSPPLFYFITFFWSRIFGSSEIAIRSLSFIFYIATALIVYSITKKLFDKKTGIIAAVLTFFNPFLFPYAFEGRMYFCLLFFVTLSFYFLITKNKVCYILAAAAALYSHHFAILAIIPQFLWQFFQSLRPKNQFNPKPEQVRFGANNLTIKRLFKTYLAVAVLYLPWVYPLFLQTKLVAGGFWLGRPKINDLINVFTHFANVNVLPNFQNKVLIITALLLLLRKWRKKDKSKDLLLTFWLIFPPVAAFLISQTKTSIFYERYLLYCLPPAMLLLSSNLRKISYFLILPIVVINLFSSYQLFTHPFKKPFREFALWIKANIPSDVFLINYNGKAHHLWESKYYGIEAPIYSENPELPFFVGTAQMTKEDIVSDLPEDKTICLITSDKIETVAIKNYEVENYYPFDDFTFACLKSLPEE